MRMDQNIEIETGTPLVMFDLKTTLIRISSYIITSDSLTNDDKKSWLFSYFKHHFKLLNDISIICLAYVA